MTTDGIEKSEDAKSQKDILLLLKIVLGIMFLTVALVFLRVISGDALLLAMILVISLFITILYLIVSYIKTSIQILQSEKQKKIV